MTNLSAQFSGNEGDLQTWLHSLSQPLTSISLALGIAAAPITRAERVRVLQTAQEECVRAMGQIQAMREAAEGAKAVVDAVAGYLREFAFYACS